MYYAEKIIDGILYCQTIPSGPWVKVSLEKQVRDKGYEIERLKIEIADLKSEAERVNCFLAGLHNNR